MLSREKIFIVNKHNNSRTSQTLQPRGYLISLSSDIFRCFFNELILNRREDSAMMLSNAGLRAVYAYAASRLAISDLAHIVGQAVRLRSRES